MNKLKILAKLLKRAGLEDEANRIIDSEGDSLPESFNKDFLSDISYDLWTNIIKYHYDYEPTYRQVKRFVKNFGERKGLPISFLGAGSGRAAYSVGEDLVLKIAIEEYSIKSNEDEYILGNDPYLSGIVPKVFLHGAFMTESEFDWILVEKVSPIKNNYDAAKYFKSNILPEVSSLSTLKKEKYFDLIKACLEGNSQEFNNLKVLISDSIPSIEEVTADLLSNSDAFRKLYSAVKKYRIDVNEIRRYNIGYAKDGRFVLLDSSFGI